MQNSIPANISLFNTKKLKTLVNNKDTRITNDMVDVILVSLLLTLNIFIPFSSVFIAAFEQVNVCWDETDAFLEAS